MTKMFRRVLIAVFCICVCLTLCALPRVFAEPAEVATDITADTAISGTGFSGFAFLKDGNVKNYVTSSGSAELKLENSAGIGGVYLLFDLEYGAYTVTDNGSGKSVTVGQQGFLHDYLDLPSLLGTAPQSVTLSFSGGAVRLSEIYALSVGTPPDFVQVWNAPLEGKTDLMLLSTHGDDDQLFFAGLLPEYAGERGCAVQVVYLTDHRNLTNARTHEMLNGLWKVGVTAYPVFGSFADFRIDSKQGTYDEYARLGTSKEELESFVVEQLRRFRPQVAVGHDLNGEYGHGMHMVYADLLVRGLDMAADESKFPESAEKYGVWRVPKTYLHLYETDPIVLDYDKPLAAFDGMTAFEVTQKLGYPCHESQQYTWFTGWINGKTDPITKATQITTYSPCKFGLYRSTVGADVAKNDFLENIVTYAEQERLEQERLEQERLEQERLEQERLEQERLEKERLEKERLEKERLEKERLAREAAKAQRARRLGIAAAVLAGLVVLLLITLLGMRASNIRRHKRRQARRRKNNP